MAVNDAHPDSSDRDAHIAALYRQAAREEPPARLDQSVRRSAREIAGTPAVRHPWRWHLPLAAAAVAIVSASLVTLMLEQGPDHVQPQPDSTRSTVQKRAHPQAGPLAEPSGPTTAESPEARGAQSVETKRQSARPSYRKDVPPVPQAADQHGSQVAGEAQSSRSEIDTRENSSPGEVTPSTPRVGGGLASAPFGSAARVEQAPPTPAPTEASPPERIGTAPAAKPLQRQVSPAASMERRDTKTATVPESLLSGLEGRPPSAWFERILELRKQERRADAEVLLAEFKRRYPHEPLPAALTSER